MKNNFKEIYDNSLHKPEEFWKNISEDVFWFKKPTIILNKSSFISPRFLVIAIVTGQTGQRRLHKLVTSTMIIVGGFLK